MSGNAFYFGDNLHVLREYIPDDSVDLIYLDPPFNSNASYNLLFKSPDKRRWSDAQITTFDDTWRWGDIADAQFREIVAAGGKGGEELSALRRILGENDMLAYLTMMAARLVELRRVLKPTGSLYLHCDPTASHYLKLILDGVFGPGNYQNEIVWRRYDRPKGSQHKSRRYGRSTDTILFFTASENHTFEAKRIQRGLSEAQKASRYPLSDSNGAYMSGPLLRAESMGARPNLVFEFAGFTPGPAGWRMSRDKLQLLWDAGDIFFTSSGQPRRKVRPAPEAGDAVDNLWDDIPALSAQARERLGYPTQKPVALLERIIAASSNPGDVILDPFCGCGTTLHAAQNLGRHWIGIDVAVQAMKVIGDRLNHAFPDVAYDVFGLPADADSAMWLAARDPFKFEEWACSRIGAMHSGRFRNDGGIDGSFFFLHGRDEPSRGIVSVKAGRNLNPGMVRDLVGTLQRERQMTGDPDAVAVLVTAHPPTGGMLEEARRAGRVETLHGEIPAVQILSVADLFAGRTIQVPLMLNTVTAAAEGRRKGRAASYVDPRDIFRQREMLFAFTGRPAAHAPSDVLPEKGRMTA